MKNKEPILSVIVNTKNEEKNLDFLAASLRGSRVSYELIVVDNFSTDKTAEAAKNVGARFFLHGPERSSQKNFGAKKAGGKYLLFMDADMTVSRGLMAECVRAAEEKRLDAIIVPLRSGGGDFWAKCRALEWRCYEGDREIEAARFFRRRVFSALKGYDEKLVSFEDWDIQDRLRQNGYLTGRTKLPLIHREAALNPLISFRKKFYYGAKGNAYFKKKIPFSWSRHTPWRRCYLRHWRLLLADPLHAVGFLVQKHFEFFGGGMGLVWSVIFRKRKK